ncbi:low molecular weight protein-tyrosine-phosphatase [Glaesserella sp.]|uniref:low molecular weight protein-tyrosine-phosphatase n=1 Tax=Glaesserella sp. TaxID=2094731 RepID=UPI00359F5127
MFRNILIVCMGNICRSPLGKVLFEQAFPNKHIESAGIATKNSGLVGSSAESTMIETASKCHLDLTRHSAQQLTEELCRNADLILVMEQKHIDAVASIAPAARGKIMLYGHWLQKEIPDPYKQTKDTFEFVYNLMEEATESWKSKLQ